ncbi:MAG TPA: discoidin domain-containing protein [Trebonia sp.]
MSELRNPISRRMFLSANAVLLAGFGLRRALPDPAAPAAAAATTLDASPAAAANLALYRPVTVSSTAYGPNPAEFAVDRLAEPGVRGTGWRAAGSDPQWITVDLQAPCSVESVVLVFEATASDPEWTPASGSNPYTNTTGWEIMSSCATAFQLDVSTDGTTWTTVYQTTTGAGGQTQIPLAEPVTARWVRMTATQQSNGSPLQVNSFQVYGTSQGPRPPATGWSNWGSAPLASPPGLTTAADGTVPIESGWALTLDQWAGAGGGALSASGAGPDGWVPATVPGTVLASLVEQGHFPDPVDGYNNLHVPEALSRHSWWYRRVFRLPAGFHASPGRHVWLEFDGINHHADIWLNGTSVGEMTHPSARGAFDVTGALADGAGAEQALAVQISPMPHPGSPGDKGPSGVSFVNSSMVSLDFPSYISVSGWDWMPAVRDRVAGIWNHVRLRSTGPAVLGDPMVDTSLPSLPDTSVAEVTITVPVRNAGTATQPVTVSAAFDEVRVSSTVSVPGGASTEVTFSPSGFPALRVSDPALWWPNGYGEPALHDLVLTASVSGTESDRRTRRFGLRQVDYVQPPLIINGATDSGSQTENFPLQTARYLRLQCGQRATQWGDSIWTLSVFNTASSSGGSPGTDLALNQTATASSVDNSSDGPQNAVDGNPDTRWSSAYEDNQWIQVDFGAPVSFDQVVITWEQAYALNYVIQVSDDGTTWTDVLSVSNTGTFSLSVNGVRVFCRGGNWGWDELLRRMLPDRMDDVMALHRDMNFTMVRNWGGCSTREEFYSGCDENGILVWTEFWEGDGLFPDEQSTAVFLAQAADTIVRYRIHPSIVVWCGANESFPPEAVDAGLSQAVVQNDPGVLYHSDSAANGTTSGGPYNWVDPTQYFSGVSGSGAFGFHTEIGLPTVSVADSMRGLIGAPPNPDADLPIDIDSATDRGTQAENFPLQHARYLRVQCYQRITGWGDSIWTLSVFNTASSSGGSPGTDLALNQTATASSADDPSRGPESAVDGNPDTRWSSAYEDNQWIQVDFGSVTAFDQVVITWESADALNYAIQVSDDGTAWTNVTQVLDGGPWFLHDWCTQGNQQVDSYQSAIEARLGTAASLGEFCVKAQFVNYESIRAMFEAWNENLWNDASGLMLWMSNPAHHSTVWQTYDYDLDVNGTYYGARKGCEAIHVQASLADWGVTVANHTTAPLRGATVTAELHDLSGNSLGAPLSQAATVPASSAAPVFTVPFGTGAPSPHLLRLRLTGQDGTLLSENVYWRYRDAADMLAFNQLPPVAVSASARRGPGTGQDQLTVTLVNRGAAVAAMVVLSLRDAESRQRILPAFYSDNYLWLLPGESRDITVSWRGGRQVAAPAILVSGYNVPARTCRA